MSGNALRVLNALPESEKKNECASKSSFTKACSEMSQMTNGIHDKRQTAIPALPADPPLNGSEGGSNGIEVGNLEIEYIESENLNDLEDFGTSLTTLLERLDSKDWVIVCVALNNARQLAIFHKEAMLEIMASVISLIVKSLKNPRSAVCKTAIMTSADIFKVYRDQVVDSFDPLLLQLLLKSSQDKRFVCEAAERALIIMTTWVSPTLLLPKLQPYLKHKNPRIRAKASMCLSRSVARLGIEGIKSYGIDKLIQIAASQLSDRLPESREAARILALELEAVYKKSQVVPHSLECEPSTVTSWEDFCQAKLSPLSAQAILRVTSGLRESSVLGC